MALYELINLYHHIARLAERIQQCAWRHAALCGKDNAQYLELMSLRDELAEMPEAIEKEVNQELTHAGKEAQEISGLLLSAALNGCLTHKKEKPDVCGK